MDIKTFIFEKIKELSQEGITVKFMGTNLINYTYNGRKDSCGGFFDTKTLAIATKMSETEWIPTFLHEYSHYLQWKSSGVWEVSDVDPYDKWISGKKVNEKKARESMICLLRDESDCEKKAVNLIRQYHLPINIRNYIKKANSYLYFHEVAYRYKDWYSIGRDPWKFESILSVMPSKFQDDYTLINNKTCLLMYELCIKENKN